MNNFQDITQQIEFYNERWRNFSFANRLKLQRAIAILNAISSTKIFEPKMVDLGCGAGWLTGIIGTFGPTVGIDLSDIAIAEASKKYNYVNFVSVNIFEWDFPIGMYDIVISQEVIEHIASYEDQTNYIDIAYNLLRKNGYFIITTPNKKIFDSMPTDMRHKWLNQPVENLLTLNEIKSLIRRKFDIINFTTIITGYGSGKVYRLVNSNKLKNLFQYIGLFNIFDSIRSKLGFGLTTLVVAKKV